MKTQYLIGLTATIISATLALKSGNYYAVAGWLYACFFCIDALVREKTFRQ